MRVNNVNNQNLTFNSAKYSKDVGTQSSVDYLTSMDRQAAEQLTDMMDYLDKSSNAAKADVLVRLDFDYINGITTLEGNIKDKAGKDKYTIAISSGASDSAFEENIEKFKTKTEKCFETENE